jgi:hypothetical protein
MMLGLLLARAGVPVTVMEKHADFLRDFRGDTVHASTLRLLDELDAALGDEPGAPRASGRPWTCGGCGCPAGATIPTDLPQHWAPDTRPS